MNQAKSPDPITVNMDKKDLTPDQKKDLEDSLKDYSAETYDVIKFDGGFFKYEAIFKNEDTTILHFLLKPYYRTPRVFEIITSCVRRYIDSRAFSLESDWVPELSSLDIVLFKFRNTLGGRERFFHRIGRVVKEELSSKI